MTVIFLVIGIIALFLVLPFVLATLCGVYDGITDSETFKKFFEDDKKQ